MRHLVAAALVGLLMAAGATEEAPARRSTVVPVTIEGGQGTAIGERFLELSEHGEERELHERLEKIRRSRKRKA